MERSNTKNGQNRGNCELWGICGGCQLAEKGTYENESSDLLGKTRVEKLEAVKDLFPQVKFRSTEAWGVRDRVDLIWEQGKLGLYGKELPTIIDIKECPLLSPSLQKFLTEFRERIPPIQQKGSVRLRVSPSGDRGVWLDFANTDVKALFEEKSYLQWLSQIAFVEIGQRRKALTWKEGAPKLTDPVLRPWFETYDSSMASIPLYGVVGGFSQAGFRVNRALVQAVVNAVEASGVKEWVELFSGNGNFALALGARQFDVDAYELDELAIAGMEKSKAENEVLASFVRAQRLDAYLKARSLPSLAGKGLLVDPPRAGMRQVLDRMVEQGDLPRALVYVSCFTEVFMQEADRLKQLGYRIRALEGVDQFPFSHHSEWIALFTFDASPH